MEFHSPLLMKIKSYVAGNTCWSRCIPVPPPSWHHATTQRGQHVYRYYVGSYNGTYGSYSCTTRHIQLRYARRRRRLCAAARRRGGGEVQYVR